MVQKQPVKNNASKESKSAAGTQQCTATAAICLGSIGMNVVALSYQLSQMIAIN